jgi:leucine zipper transcription factor-like protein 1
VYTSQCRFLNNLCYRFLCIKQERVCKMSDVLAGLSNESKSILDAYLNWAKIRHDKFGRDLEFEANTFRTGNLLSQTYSRAEVEAVLRGQFDVLVHSLEKQHQFITNSSAELCRSVLHEADRNRIPLNINAVECLQNATAVSAMEQHEQRLLGGPKGKLAPLTSIDTGGEAGKQLAEANEVIRTLNEKVRRLTEQYTALMQDRSRNSDAFSHQDSLFQTSTSAEDLQTLAALRGELAQSQSDLLQKVNNTPQFQQLKKMLGDKNAQLKALRARLAVCDPTYSAPPDDDA